MAKAIGCRGITVPVLRQLARRYQELSREQVLPLLRSRWHEDRLLALLIAASRSAEVEAAIAEDARAC